LRVLCFQFADRNDPSRWVRVFLVLLPYYYTDKLSECVKLLANLQKARNQLWLLRNPPPNRDIEKERPGQIYTRLLPASQETDLRALVQILKQQERYPAEVWAKSEAYLFQKPNSTYLGELLREVREAMDKLPSSPNSREPREPLPGTLVDGSLAE